MFYGFVFGGPEGGAEGGALLGDNGAACRRWVATSSKQNQIRDREA